MLTTPEAMRIAADLIEMLDNDDKNIRPTIWAALTDEGHRARDLTAITVAALSIAWSALNNSTADMQDVLDGIRCESTWQTLIATLKPETGAGDA